MFIDDCINCKIIIGPCDGALFIRTSTNCSISAVCKQLRFRDCRNIKIFTYCPSDPVVENCSLIKFAPYNVSLPRLKELFTKANFNPKENKYQAVYDFTEQKNVNNEQHWELMREDEFEYNEVKPEDYGDASGEISEPIYQGYLEDELKGFMKVENDNHGDNKSNQNDFGFEIINSNDLNEANSNVDLESEPISRKTPDTFNTAKSEDIIVTDNININIENFANSNYFVTSNDVNNVGDLNAWNVVNFENDTGNATGNATRIDLNIENNLNDFNYKNTNINNNFPISNNNNFFTNFETSDEESKALKLRQLEEEKRQKEIRNKIEDEFRIKCELREKSKQFIENFNRYNNKGIL